MNTSQLGLVWILFTYLSTYHKEEPTSDDNIKYLSYLSTHQVLLNEKLKTFKTR